MRPLELLFEDALALHQLADLFDERRLDLTADLQVSEDGARPKEVGTYIFSLCFLRYDSSCFCTPSIRCLRAFSMSFSPFWRSDAI